MRPSSTVLSEWKPSLERYVHSVCGTNIKNTIQGIYLSSDDFYSERNLVLGLIRVEVFNVLMLCLNCHRWLVLGLYPLSCVGAGVRR
jgi:hypothetical protein